ncbi:hypothetical protein ACR6C2_37785 [Streptomyces sp. INA 01156]
MLRVRLTRRGPLWGLEVADRGSVTAASVLSRVPADGTWNEAFGTLVAEQAAQSRAALAPRTVSCSGPCGSTPDRTRRAGCC